MFLDEDSGDTDMLSTFVFLSTLQGDCKVNSNDAMSNLLPLLLFKDGSSSNSDSLMTMLMFSTMSGDQALDIQAIFMMNLLSFAFEVEQDSRKTICGGLAGSGGSSRL